MEIQAIRLPTSAHTVRQPSLTRANRQNASATAAAGENHTGMYSAHARNAFSECASTISPVRHTRLNSMKTSSHRSCAPRQMFPFLLPATVLGTQLLRHSFQLDLLLQQFVVSMPLHKIRAAHERAMLSGAPVIVPYVEKDNIDGALIRLVSQHSLLAQSGNPLLRLLHFFVRRLHYF